MSKDTHTPLFSRDVFQWNHKLMDLCEWTSFYDVVYQHPERPGKEVIEDDELLDKWWRDKVVSEAESPGYLARTSQSPHSHKSAWDHQEVVVFGT